MSDKTASLKPDSPPPQDYQRRVADRVNSGSPRLLVYHGTGLGKSRTAIMAAERSGEPYVAAMPASLRANFSKERAKWTDEATPSETMSYTALGAGKAPSVRPSTVVFDEAQALRNPDSARTRAATALAAKADRVMLLSGTPITNRPGDLAPIVNILSGTHLDPDSFERRYVGQDYDDRGLLGWLTGAEKHYHPAVAHPGELEGLLRGKVDYQPGKDPEGVTTHDRVVDVDLDPDQDKFNRDLLGRLPWLARMRLRRNYPLSDDQVQKLRSFFVGSRESGLSLSQFGSKAPLEAFQGSGKLRVAGEHLLKKLEDPRAKALVFSQFIDAGLRPYDAFLAEKKIPHALFHGGLSDEQRRQVVDDYNTGKIRALLLGPSAAEGISTKGTGLVQMLDEPFNEARIRQSRGRALRFDSHLGLPADLKDVEVERYRAHSPRPGFLGRLFGRTAEPTADEVLSRLSARKEEVNKVFLDLLQRVGSEKSAGWRDQLLRLVMRQKAMPRTTPRLTVNTGQLGRGGGFYGSIVGHADLPAGVRAWPTTALKTISHPPGSQLPIPGDHASHFVEHRGTSTSLLAHGAMDKTHEQALRRQFETTDLNAWNKDVAANYARASRDGLFMGRVVYPGLAKAEAEAAAATAALDRTDPVLKRVFSPGRAAATAGVGGAGLGLGAWGYSRSGGEPRGPSRPSFVAPRNATGPTVDAVAMSSSPIPTPSSPPPLLSPPSSPATPRSAAAPSPAAMPGSPSVVGSPPLAPSAGPGSVGASSPGTDAPVPSDQSGSSPEDSGWSRYVVPGAVALGLGGLGLYGLHRYLSRPSEEEEDEKSAPQLFGKEGTVVDDLKAAKRHSDRRNYPAKHAILRRLLESDPEAFHVDSHQGHFVGLTHTGSGFKIHMPRPMVPEGVKPLPEADEKAAAEKQALPWGKLLSGLGSRAIAGSRAVGTRAIAGVGSLGNNLAGGTRFAAGLAPGATWSAGSVGRLLTAPRYPGLDRPLGVAVSPRAFDATRAFAGKALRTGGAAGMGLSGAAALDGIVRKYPQAIGAEVSKATGVVPADVTADEIRRHAPALAADSVAGAFGGGDPSPISAAHREAVGRLVPRSLMADVTHAREKRPWLMGAVDAMRSTTPAGLLTTIGLRSLPKVEYPDVAGVAREAAGKYLPAMLGGDGEVRGPWADLYRDVASRSRAMLPDQVRNLPSDAATPITDDTPWKGTLGQVLRERRNRILRHYHPERFAPAMGKEGGISLRTVATIEGLRRRDRPTRTRKARPAPRPAPEPDAGEVLETLLAGRPRRPKLADWRAVPDAVVLRVKLGDGPLQAAQSALGGPNALTNSLVYGALGSGIGYGGGLLAEGVANAITPEGTFRRGRLRRAGAILGGLAGAATGPLHWHVAHAAEGSPTQGDAMGSLLTDWPWRPEDMPDKAGAFLEAAMPEVDAPGWAIKAADDFSSNTGALFTPSIPVDAFGNACWLDVNSAPNPYGSRDPYGDNSRLIGTPPHVAAAATAAVAAAGAARNSSLVSPWDVAAVAGRAAGTGYLGGLVLGRTIGVLAGLSPEAQARMREVGLWGGMLSGAVAATFGR